MVGREVGVTLFGYGTKDAFLAAVGPPEDPELIPIAVKSLQWDFPVLEYRPFREYGSRYTFATFVQLGLGFDHPVSAVVVDRPGAAGAVPPDPLPRVSADLLRRPALLLTRGAAGGDDGRYDRPPAAW